jgi:hypothetical protein
MPRATSRAIAFGVHGVTAASCATLMYGRGVTPRDLQQQPGRGRDAASLR